MYRPFWAVLLLLVWSACGLVGCGAAPQPLPTEQLPEQPNVLFIAVDDLNDWTGYLGGHPQAHTPNIDQLAKQGTAFTYAYCPAPACGPSRTALMYGLYPHRSGSYGHHAIYDPKNRLDPSQLPMNLAFQRAGYYTAGCGKIFHYPEPRGWDEFQRGFGGKRAESIEAPGPGIRIKTGIIETDNDSETGEGKAADWTIAQLQRKHDKPFFIAMGLYQPHEPWVSPRTYYERHPLDRVKLPDVPANDLEDVPAHGRVFAEQLVGFRPWNDHTEITAVDGAWQKLVRGYLASCSFSDSNVGRVLDALAESPHADNTIVVLWGDHGWHLGEKQAWRKMTLWERGTRTPLIIRLPNQQAGTRVDAPVTLLDLYPTLAELCNLKLDQPLDGASLTPLINDADAAWDRPALMSHGPGNFAIRLGRYRLIRYANGSEELYDIHNDPQEHTNLAGDLKHRAALESLREHVPTTWQYIMGPRFERFADSFTEPKEE